MTVVFCSSVAASEYDGIDIFDPSDDECHIVAGQTILTKNDTHPAR